MMEEEELYFVCPSYSAGLVIDSAGDLVVDQLPELEANESRGISGLKVQHSGATPDDLKLFNQQKNKARESLIDVPVLGNDPRAVQWEQAISDANNKDLQKRNIQPTKRSKK
ncbi:hypothetical protein SynBIOSE41_01789 [Synechococcus sp. BIOS-E4-1]|uniref:hypothetical protein n=1 Tax=Synechococcus sp. BIOS-E4-1 TaxID=1400864 RepID=UPI001645C3A7|nr:hypothetical protein [Synechococcus sp. BIOS-E4-1]QNI54300.1 hypothetical protein SynBIOSE41_01789 [Synechococcus sp. BIOS-E4-1]